MEIFFISVLSLALISVGFFTIIQHFKHKKEKAIWENLTEEKIHQIKSESTEYIRNTIDKISSTAQEYATKSDRDMLMSIILALDTYGRRIDRIDDKLDGIYNYKSYIDAMNSQIQKTSQYFILLNEKITELDDMFSICQTTLQKTAKEVKILNTYFTNTIELEPAIKQNIDLLSECAPTLSSTSYQIQQILNEIETFNKFTIDLKPAIKQNFDLLNEYAPTLYSTNYQVQQILSEIETLNKKFTYTIELEPKIEQNIELLNEYAPTLYSTSYQVRQILNETEKLISSYDSSPATKIKKIETASEKTLNILDEIESHISSIKSDVSTYSDMHSDIHKIKDSVVGSYDSLYDTVSDIKSDMWYIKSDISSARSDISDVKSDVSSARSDISDIKYSLH